MKYRQYVSGLLLCVLCHAGPSIASVVIAGTRVVFPSAEKEVTIKLNNEGKTPGLVQVWLDKGNRDDAPGDVKVPFVLTPPLFRLDPGKGQTLRMLYTREPLPADRESLFWLNVLEIPPKGPTDKDADSNLIQMAFRTRVKVFYRPSALDTQASLEKAYRQIRWAIKPDSKAQGVIVEATNPTPYYMSITKLNLSSQQHRVEMDHGEMIAPFGHQQFKLASSGSRPDASWTLGFSLLNDYGSEVSITSPVS